MHPHKKCYRLLVIGQKRLPAISDRGERTWGFVEKASRAAQALQEEFAPATYQTKTHGEQTQPTARPAGEGVYAIVRHANHTHRVYALELPDKPGAVQEELHLVAEGSYIGYSGDFQGPPPGSVASPPEAAVRRGLGKGAVPVQGILIYMPLKMWRWLMVGRPAYGSWGGSSGWHRSH